MRLLRCFVALWGILCALVRVSGDLSSAASAVNPLAGQGVPPAPYTAYNFPVGTLVLITQLMEVNEVNFSFKAEPTNLVAFDGQTVPMNYELKFAPDGMHPKGSIAYIAVIQGWFSMAMHYGAYPFDKHYLCMDLRTAFVAQISHNGTGAAFASLNGYVIKDQGQLPTNASSAPSTGLGFRPSLSNLGLPGWSIGATTMDVMKYTIYASSNVKDFEDGGKNHKSSPASYYAPGVRIYLEINRVSKGYFICIVVVPISLIILFSFGIFSIPRRELKARINLLATLLLTLIILQFVLTTILPGAFTLLSPYILIIVSPSGTNAVPDLRAADLRRQSAHWFLCESFCDLLCLFADLYTFLLLGVTVMSHALHNQHLRRTSKHTRNAVCNEYQKWKRLLLDGLPVSVEAGGAESRNASLSDQESVCTPTVLSNRSGVCGLNGQPGDLAVPPHRRRDRSTEEGICTEEPDATWLNRQQKAWYSRVWPLMKLELWWRFIGKKESRLYGEYIAHQFDQMARLVLVSTYIMVVLIIFIVAKSRSDQEARIHVFPT